MCAFLTLHLLSRIRKSRLLSTFVFFRNYSSNLQINLKEKWKCAITQQTQYFINYKDRVVSDIKQSGHFGQHFSKKAEIS